MSQCLALGLGVPTKCILVGCSSSDPSPDLASSPFFNPQSSVCTVPINGGGGGGQKEETCCWYFAAVVQVTSSPQRLHFQRNGCPLLLCWVWELRHKSSFWVAYRVAMKASMMEERGIMSGWKLANCLAIDYTMSPPSLISQAYNSSCQEW